MAKNVLPVVLCCLLVENVLGQFDSISTTTITFHKEDMEFTRAPQVDTVGGVVGLIDTALTQISRSLGVSTPSSSSCNTLLIRLGRSEMKISQRPRGYCSYCCRIANPSKYVRLYLTNKANGVHSVELKMRKKRGLLRAAGLDSNLPTVIFIHGFLEHGNGPGPNDIRNAFLSLDQNYNIIIVDWGELVAFPWYPQAVQNTQVLGPIMTKFIKFYNDAGELSISNLHLIGFSLGAHLAGMIGKSFPSQKIRRISALDPALPLISVNDSAQVLSKTDAEFVDVIHTNAGAFGISTSLGHADFYPNAGQFIQPGCDAVHTTNDEHIAEQYLSCSHSRAWKFYAESVRNPAAFPATKCGIVHDGSLKQCGFITDGYMGFPASKDTTSGDFYLTTNDRKPFGKSAKDQEADVKTVNLVL